MKLDAVKFGLASAVTCGIVYVVVSLFAVFARGFLIKVYNVASPGLDLSSVALAPTWGAFIAGLILTFVGMWVVTWFFVWVYNKLVG